MADSQVLKALLPDNPLCGISTYKDTLNLATGACTRRIVKIIYKGASNENWNKSSSGYNGFYIGIPYHEAGTQTFCNMAQYDNDGTLYRSAPWYCVSDWTFAISTDSAVVGGTTVEDWKAYLATLYANGTPLTIWHVTDNPTTETITVPSGLSGTEEGYLTQSGTPSPSAPIYPTANTVNVWQHSLRKLTTATEAVENPLYSDGTAISTYTIKGNTTQSGTPTPSNPVMPNGVGERTENLCNITSSTSLRGNVGGSGTYIRDNSISVYMTGQDTTSGVYIPIFPEAPAVGSVYTMSFVPINSTNNTLRLNMFGEPFVIEFTSNERISFTKTVPNNATRIIAFYGGDLVEKTTQIMDIQVESGNTAHPYEPNGYKIPITNGQQTTNIYLESTQSYRQIQKLILDGNEESWSRSTSYLGGFFSSWSYFGGMKYGAIYCSHAQYVSDITEYVSGTCYSDGSLNIRIMPEDSTVTQWREYLAQQYANGTPVTVWYALATPTTGIVNEPLMKIGTYADTLSNAVSIPTTEGANSITVDTTVQPSEFTATWTGWHDSSVKEKSENLLSPDMTFNASCGNINDANCFPYSFGGNRQTAFFYCKPSTKYTFSAVNPDRLFIYEYNETKTAEELAEYTPENPLAADRLITWQNPIADNPAQFVTSATAKMVSIYYSLNNVATDVMTNEGQTALPYEPYWK